MTELLEADESTFTKLVLRADKPVLVDFWAQWCPPCHQIVPILKQVAVERTDRLTVVKVNSDEN
ncbi:MAG: thioredoxin 1, partial [Kribbellaceae bacterium]|nr:thioredoxin 1 [Kribbellaceae bacterium]